MVVYLVALVVMALLLVGAVVAHMSLGVHREKDSAQTSQVHVPARQRIVDELKMVEDLLEERKPHLHDVIFSHY